MYTEVAAQPEPPPFGGSNGTLGRNRRREGRAWAARAFYRPQERHSVAPRVSRATWKAQEVAVRTLAGASFIRRDDTHGKTFSFSRRWAIFLFAAFWRRQSIYSTHKSEMKKFPALGTFICTDHKYWKTLSFYNKKIGKRNIFVNFIWIVIKIYSIPPFWLFVNH